ncbi:MAG: bifunctional DNA-formamidopyrimidine glycosylase/DNA-(apurinic or apyrimidinic site) lyase [Actinomycetia bacterium]|nr:bifunctional DNA-formamidopyrimidine glycosylase/DNA-(apurinic or apyrimidinic site) lyase [Actinomycetes bacterium]MCP4961008.1 bifunctional DNA-formamidopyrimidine glycosylase/DNA-(apurinic or apyrimidinic site) lyase [Actinomycetes bacterium]
MPELPEVETVRRGLEPGLIGRVIVEARCTQNPKFTSAPDVIGAAIETVGRRGKYLIIGFEDDREMIVHLGMTGVLNFGEGPSGPHERAAWRLDDDRWLIFTDVRQFGRVAVVDGGEYSSLPTLQALGPEPFDESLDAHVFWQALSGSKQRIKTRLLSQRPIAGVGNIYADEACWLARINPASRRITKAQAADLLEAIRSVLAAGLTNGGTTLRDYRTVTGEQGANQHELKCYGRAGQECPRCGAELVSKVYDGRTTTWCRDCQPSH